jgi:tetratricopeptide (TPR) repeat protein
MTATSIEAGALQRIRFFISSPRDVRPERRIVLEVLRELNRSAFVSPHYALKALAYEEIAPAEMGDTPQNIIDKYMRADACEVYIGILWHRMGTPTRDLATQKQYASGTEYEFQKAYAAGVTTGKPTIFLYRCLRDVPQDADLDQWAQVKGFWARCGGDGAEFQGLPKSYVTLEEFKAMVEHDIEQFLSLRWNQENLPSPPSRPVSLPGLHTGAKDTFGAPFDLALLTVPRHFVGREKERAWLRARLAGRASTAGIAAVIGMSGIGKSALAAVASRALYDEGRFPGGIAVALCQEKRTQAEATQILIDVLTRFDPRRRVPKVANQQRRIPKTTDAAGLAEVARSLLSGPEALVVLDNVEPELPIDRVVAPLREAGATLLLTARQILPAEAVPAEGRLTLDLLSEAEALDLLAHSFGRDGMQELGELEQAAAERIVAALGRHTLAVTLAGAYAGEAVRDMGKLAEQLEDPQQALKLPKGDAPNEVKRVFASSYAALTSEAQRLFASLAAFPTTEFARERAVTLAEKLNLREPAASVDLLVRRALASVQGERLRLHLLMRALASAEFATWPEEERLTAQLVVSEIYATLANDTPDEALGPDEANIIGVLEWAHSRSNDALVVQLCVGICNYWRDLSKNSERERYLPWGVSAAERIVSDTHNADDLRRLAALQLSHADLLFTLGRTRDAEKDVELSLATYQQVGDRREEGLALSKLGDVQLQRGELESAQANYEQALAIMREVRDRREEGLAFGRLGDLLMRRGELESAQVNYEQYLTIMRKVGDRGAEAWGLGRLGDVLLQRGEPESAQANYEQALPIMRQVGDRSGEGWALGRLGDILRQRGELERAQTNYEQALAIMRKVGDRREEGAALTRLADLLLRRGELESAQVNYEQALPIMRQVGDRNGESWALGRLGDILLQRGEMERARTDFERALAIMRETGDPAAEGQLLSRLHDLQIRPNEVDSSRGYHDHSEPVSGERHEPYQ